MSSKTKIKIYHNPRCTKSRETLAILQEKGQDVEIVEYLKDNPGYDELKDLLMKLHLKPEQILRKNEALYREKYKTLKLNDDEWIRIMVENPILIERPIVVRGNKAVLGRPPQNVLELL